MSYRKQLRQIVGFVAVMSLVVGCDNSQNQPTSIPPTTAPIPPTTAPIPPTTAPIPPTTAPIPPTTAPVAEVPSAPTLAPPLNQSAATDIATAAEFLYTGTNPIQTGVISGAIEAQRTAVLRGHVNDR